MGKRKTYWFVEPLDSWTNQIIADILNNSSEEGYPRFGLYVIKNHCLPDLVETWQVDHSLISKLYRNRKRLFLEFRVYNSQTVDGPARPWKFEEKAYRGNRKK